jgi:hypothetical protein
MIPLSESPSLDNSIKIAILSARIDENQKLLNRFHQIRNDRIKMKKRMAEGQPIKNEGGHI